MNTLTKEKCKKDQKLRKGGMVGPRVQVFIKEKQTRLLVAVFA